MRVGAFSESVHTEDLGESAAVPETLLSRVDEQWTKQRQGRSRGWVQKADTQGQEEEG